MPNPKAAPHNDVVREPRALQDVQPQKVKIPKPPVAVHEAVTDKELAPPARPKQPSPDLNAKPKPLKVDASDRSKDRDKDKDKDKDAPDKRDSPK